jgi:hypothetical protein
MKNTRQNDGRWRARCSGEATSPSIEVRIEELFLHGFAMGDRFRISDALECGLAQLIAEQGVPVLRPATPVTIERLDGGAFTVALGSKAQAIGNRVAQAVYRGLAQDARISGRLPSPSPVSYR